MKIGIISDTHNDFETTQKAIDIFKENDVNLIIHAGDITSYKMLRLFDGLNCRFVLGNMDFDIANINKESLRLGFDTVEYSCEIVINGKIILVMHGNNVPVFRNAVSSGKYNYIIKGHTHKFENYISNEVRIINPGSLGSGNERSVIILYLDEDIVEKVVI